MDTQDLRTDLHRLIDQTQNNELLAAVRTILDLPRRQEADFWDKLNSHQQDDIKAGIDDIGAGRVTPSSVVFDRYE